VLAVVVISLERFSRRVKNITILSVHVVRDAMECLVKARRCFYRDLKFGTQTVAGQQHKMVKWKFALLLQEMDILTMRTRPTVPPLPPEHQQVGQQIGK